MAEDRSKDFDVINVKELARQSKIPYPKLRNCIVGNYASLTEAEKTDLFNKLEEGFTRAAAFLGFTHDGRRIKPKD